jgi:hypothetical protein
MKEILMSITFYDIGFIIVLTYAFWTTRTLKRAVEGWKEALLGWKYSEKERQRMESALKRAEDAIRRRNGTV